MANFNNGKYIKYAIQSILDQTYKHIELVVVDDCSQDNSMDILEDYSLSYSKIRIICNPENKGCGYTKRRAANLARGSLMGFLDPDDVLMPSALEIMVKAHSDHENVSLIGSSHFVCNEDLIHEREAYGACHIPEHENYLTFGRGVTAFASFKKTYYQLTEGIDEHFKRAVDQDLYYKLEEVGEVLFIPQILYKYRVHPRGISSYGNIAKSRYWLIKAKEAAHNRRLRNKSIKNITISELRSWWSVLYATKAGVALGQRKYCVTIYWMFKSAIKNPIDKFFMLKLKSLFIHSKPNWFKEISR